MTENPNAPDIVDDGVTDVLTDEEVVHVNPGVADLVESTEHHGETFVTDVPAWNEPDA
jgi:hypothetical protein